MRSLFVLSLVLLSSAAWAAAPRHGAPRQMAATPPAAAPVPATPYDSCEAAIAAAEKAQAVPSRILPAIGRVESGRVDPATGRVRPWPWAINVEGQGHWFETKDEAIATVQALQARGVRSIDVGCMQVNLMHHPTAFATLDAAFDPATNAAYGARFLATLNRQTGSWPLAVADYHSATPELGIPYQQRVMAGMPGYAPLILPAGAAGAFAGTRSAEPFAAWAPAGTIFAAFVPQSRIFGAFAPAPDLALQRLASGRKRLTLAPGGRATTQVAELPVPPIMRRR
jgi:soluble lytic murein transglycosylase-like protein